MSENNFQPVCDADQIPAGQSKAFSITGLSGSKIEIALFNIAGTFYATSNVFINQGGPLSKGAIEGDIVACPWHGWKYSAKNGKSPHKGGDSVSSYPVQVLEGKVYVSPVPANVGKKMPTPHRAYRELDSTVKQHLANVTGSQVLPVDARAWVLGISATNMNDDVTPRTSTSEAALEFALDYAKSRYDKRTL